MGTGAVGLHQERFAKWYELRELLSRDICPDGVLLGTRRDFLFFKRFVVVRPTKNRREIGNTLIVGPTRSGKGLLAVSQLLSWNHSCLVNDIKGELFSATAGYRKLLGDVYVIDPTGVGHCFDPLHGKQTEDELLSAAKHLLYQPDERDKVFTQRSIGMLSRLFTAAKIEGQAPFPYVRSLIRSSLRSCATRLNMVDPHLAARFLYADYNDANFENKFLVSAWETLLSWLEPLFAETVIRSLTRSDFSPEQIMRGDRPVTVYLRWKEQDLLALSPLVRLLWGTLIDGLITIFDDNQGSGCRPVLLLIDEAGRTAIPALSDQATTVVGRGIYLWVAVQSLSQLEAVYGRARAQVLQDNMETHLYYPPNDIVTAKHIADWLGDTSAYAHSTTSKDGEEVQQGLTERGVPLLTAQEIAHLSDTEIICFHRRLHPCKIDRMDWRRHEALKQRRSIPAPVLPTLPPVAPMPEPGAGSETLQPPVDYINPDMLNRSGETPIIDLFSRKRKPGLVN
jgi:type IV secretion system protein VirD4